MAKIDVSVPKKRKLGPKNVDYIFLGYAFHSIGCIFLVVKTELSDMNLATIME